MPLDVHLSRQMVAPCPSGSVLLRRIVTRSDATKPPFRCWRCGGYSRTEKPPETPPLDPPKSAAGFLFPFWNKAQASRLPCRNAGFPLFLLDQLPGAKPGVFFVDGSIGHTIAFRHSPNSLTARRTRTLAKQPAIAGPH